MRRGRLALAAGCLLLGAAGVPGAAGQTGDGGLLAAFSAEADAYGVSTSVKVLRALPLPVEVFAPRSRAQIDSQPRSIGFSAPVDIPLGELLGLLGIPVTPPTFCYSYFPTTAENPADNQCGVVPFDSDGDERAVRLLAGAGSTHSRGDAEQAEKAQVKSQAAGNFLQAPAFSIGTISTMASTEVVDGVSTARSEVSLGAIDIGGIVHIDSIRSAATARANGTTDVEEPDADLTIGGMSIAGVPVRLTGEGLLVGKVPSLPLIPIVGVGVPVPDTTTALPLPAALVVKPIVDALNSNGITFGVLEPPVRRLNQSGTEATASVRGVVFGYRDEASGDFVELRLGVSTASATASANDDGVSEEQSGVSASSDADVEPSTGDTGADLASGGTGALSEPGSEAGALAVGTSPRVAPPAGTSAPVQHGLVATGPANVVTIARITTRLRGMYAAGALSTLVLLAGLVFVLPARRRVWRAVVPRR